MPRSHRRERAASRLRSRMANALCYGNNLDVLRESITTESEDLIYLDSALSS